MTVKENAVILSKEKSPLKPVILSEAKNPGCNIFPGVK